MSKKKPVFSVEKTLAGIAKSVHDLREEGESTDRMVVALTKSVATLTVRLENAETAINSLLDEVEELRKPARTWLQFLRGE